MLKQQTFSAIRWTSLGLVLKAILQLAQVAILARILGAEDFGLMAMVSVVLSFAAIFSDFGVNSGFVQRQDVSDSQRSSLFWFNVILCFVLSAILSLTSPFIAYYFGDNRLAPLLILSSTTFWIGALGLQARLAAEKQLAFRPVMIIELVTAVIALATATLFAVFGYGVYSLVYSAIFASVITSILSLIFLSQGFFPVFRVQWDEIKPFLRFGLALMASNLTNQLNRTVDIFLVGRFLGAANLGYYSMPRNIALQLQGVINPVVTRVTFPLIAKIQADTDRVRVIYLQTMNMTSATNGPLYLFGAVFAGPLLNLLLGERWEPSATILSVLLCWGLLRSTGNPVGSLLLGCGRSDLALKWNITLLALVPPSVWIGSSFGPIGVAWALLFLQILLLIPNWYYLVRPLCGAKFGEYFIATFRSVAISVVAVGLAFITSWWMTADISKLFVAVAIVVPLYVLLSIHFNRPWIESMTQLLGIQRSPFLRWVLGESG